MKPSTDDNIDQLLRQFFRNETPARWPEAPGGAVVRSASQSWTLSAGRALVGGALVATVLLYVGLSGFFPSERPTGLTPGGERIGHRPGLKIEKSQPVAPKNP